MVGGDYLDDFYPVVGGGETEDHQHCWDGGVCGWHCSACLGKGPCCQK